MMRLLEFLAAHEDALLAIALPVVLLVLLAIDCYMAWREYAYWSAR